MSPRARDDSMRARRQVGSLRRPLNFTVRHHMRVVVRVVAGLLAAASLPLTGLADELRLSGLRIHWLDGFTLASKRDALPMKLVGAAGEDVGISVMRRSTPYPREQGASALKRHEDFAQHPLVALATKRGELVLPLQRTVLADGEILYCTGTRTKRSLSVEGFYLQFFLISRPDVVALVTVEGKGNVESEMKRFRPLFDTVSWEQ